MKNQDNQEGTPQEEMDLVRNRRIEQSPGGGGYDLGVRDAEPGQHEETGDGCERVVEHAADIQP